MPEPSAYHREIYKDTAIPLRDRLRVVTKQREATLVQEAQRTSRPIGFSEYPYKSGYFGFSSGIEERLLEYERQIQAIKIAAVVKQLGVTEEACFDALPNRFPKQSPLDIELGLDTPLLVPRFPGLNWLEVVEASKKTGVGFNTEVLLTRGLIDRVSEVIDQADNAAIDKPYAAWAKIPPTVPHPWVPRIYDPGAFDNPMLAEVAKSPMFAVFTLDEGTKASTVWDGLALAMLRKANPRTDGQLVFHDLIGAFIDNEALLSFPQVSRGAAFLDLTDPNTDRGRRAPIILSQEITTR